MAAVPPYFRCDHDVPDLSALQALAAGAASPEQQRRALDWIIKQGAATYDQTFVPGDASASAFFEGRRFVGLTIVTLLSTSLSDYMAKNALKAATPKETYGTRRR